MPAWLKNAVFYEIYPQSFRDSNGDGIGDFNGIIQKLDYIRDLGCNALWINPCFDSPFKDAGYDVRDYKKAAPRYGTNEDLCRLFEEAHKRGIHVLLDLVPGHTSEEHEWFQRSARRDPKERGEYGDRYIWTDFCFQGSGALGLPYIAGESERSGTYILNFFKCQPALNYGFLHPEEPWQLPADAPAAIATREAMKEVMRFWLDRGCDGFRIDMASSLVKGDDEKKSGTSAIWRNVRQMLDREYPEAAIIAEWGNPSLAIPAGYHMDFALNVVGSGYQKLLRDYYTYRSREEIGIFHVDEVGEDHTYFKKDGHGDFTAFLADWEKWAADTKGLGYVSLISCNHDTVRPRYNLDPEELKIAYSFLFTMPGVPFLYYGDEIGMRYQDLPSFEGGYYRTGSRTPMQWDRSANLGFSEGAADSLYLPVDPAEDAPTVEAQAPDPGSLYNTVRRILKLRSEVEELQADTPAQFLYAQKGEPLIVYRRGSVLVAMNPSGEKIRVKIDTKGAGKNKEVLYRIGESSVVDGTVAMGPQSFVVVR